MRDGERAHSYIGAEADDPISSEDTTKGGPVLREPNSPQLRNIPCIYSNRCAYHCDHYGLRNFKVHSLVKGSSGALGSPWLGCGLRGLQRCRNHEPDESRA